MYNFSRDDWCLRIRASGYRYCENCNITIKSSTYYRSKTPYKGYHVVLCYGCYDHYYYDPYYKLVVMGQLEMFPDY